MVNTVIFANISKVYNPETLPQLKWMVKLKITFSKSWYQSRLKTKHVFLTKTLFVLPTTAVPGDCDILASQDRS